MGEKNIKAGLFVLVSLALLAVMILRVSQGGFFMGRSYPLYIEVGNAVGISNKTPVMIAGVEVGFVDNVSLGTSGKALVKILVNEQLALPGDTRAGIKTTGILGDAYIELVPGNPSVPVLPAESVIGDVAVAGDFNALTGQMAQVADDVKAITAQMRKLTAGDDSSFTKTMKNIEKVSDNLARLSTKNEQNINDIIANMKNLSANLDSLVAKNDESVSQSIYNIEAITGKINNGQGTVGKLINDPTTVDNLNDVLDGANSVLGGVNRMQVDLGMHSEYLAGTGDFKNYVHLHLKPRPDKYFLFQAVSDPDPSFRTSVEETTITSGATSSQITTTRRNKTLDGMLFSAQIAKRFKELTLRGGLIESSGGVGLDYERGPFGVQFSAFDFKSDFGQKPHLKLMGTTRVSKHFQVLGGFDDFINPNQDLAWFLGGGIMFTDDDLKSLLGLFAAGAN